MMHSMFSSGVSVQGMRQQAGIDRGYYFRYQLMRPKYDVFEEKLISKFLSNLDNAKSALLIAVKDYLKKINGEWFRGTGRQRGTVFLNKLNEAKNFVELIAALKIAIKDGNENYDSLKTYIYNMINSKFADNQLSSFYDSIFHTYKFFLNGLIERLDKEVITEYISNATGLSKNLSQITRNYLI